jgi:hypothetical protein
MAYPQKVRRPGGELNRMERRVLWVLNAGAWWESDAKGCSEVERSIRGAAANRYSAGGREYGHFVNRLTVPVPDQEESDGRAGH